MSAVSQVYDDRWGAVLDHADAGYIEIRWYDATEDMSADDFNGWLAEFAGHVERARRPGVIVDTTRFLMDRANMDDEWRDANIIPRYNGAGVQRFAFLVPDGMPAVGQPPVAMGPSSFPTAYFARRQDALDWLAS
jgi:hypothetical protein